MNEDLARERCRTTFRVKELSEFLVGGQENHDAIKNVETQIYKDPVFDKSIVHFLSDKEIYEDSFRRSVHFLAMKKLLNFEEYSPVVQIYISSVLQPTNPLSLHKSMFTSIVKGLGNEEQVAKWLPLIENYQIIGTYAQTEMGHGTFVRGLETTASYNPKNQTFVLNSPTLSAAKWWPGSLAHTSTHAVVMARLITEGKDRGIHAFMVQLRSLENHRMLPGVKVGFLGPKMGYKNVDNGYLILEKVEVPRENMLMRYAQVSPDGRYSKIRGSEKLAYMSMVSVRVFLVMQSAVCLAKACTIAIRYSAVRRQSKLDASERELQILDYKTQQHSLLPVLATTYAFWFTFFEMGTMFLEVEHEIAEGNLSNAQELHATSAGLKAFTTQTAATGVETCRVRCGGHGYLMSSGLPSIYLDSAAPSCTYEGDNVVMMLQTARYLVKCCSRLASGDAVSTPTAAYLSAITKDTKCIAATPQAFRDSDVLIKVFRHRAARLVIFSSGRLQEMISRGLTPEKAFNDVSVDLLRAAKAHCHLYVLEQFAKAVVKRNISAELRVVLKALFSLYGVHGIVENAQDFLEDQYMTGEQIRIVKDVEMDLLEELRPNAVGLVDAFDFSDQNLNSVLGRYDGNVYEYLMKSAKRYPLNQQEVLPVYDKYIRPLLKGQVVSKL